MKIYLDLCCFNRPFDDQTKARIKLETEAKLVIQEKDLLKIYQEKMIPKIELEEQLLHQFI